MKDNKIIAVLSSGIVIVLLGTISPPSGAIVVLGLLILFAVWLKKKYPTERESE